MAEDIKLKVGLDITEMLRSLKQIEQYSNDLLKKASNSGNQIPQLSKSLRDQMVSPRVSQGAIAGNAKDLENAVRNQAKLVSLTLQELETRTRIARGTKAFTVSRPGSLSRDDAPVVAGIKQAGFTALEQSLGRTLTPDLLKVFNSEINSVLEGFRKQFKNVPLQDHAEVFKRIGKVENTPWLQDFGATRAVTSVDINKALSQSNGRLTAFQQKLDSYGAVLDKQIAAGASNAAATDNNTRSTMSASERRKQQAFNRIDANAASRADELERNSPDYQNVHSRNARQIELDDFGTAAGPLNRFIAAVEDATGMLARNTVRTREMMARFMAEEEALISKIRGLSAMTTLDDRTGLLQDRITGQAQQGLLRRTLAAGEVSELAYNPEYQQRAVIAEAQRLLGSEKIKTAADMYNLLGDERRNLTADQQYVAAMNALMRLEAVVDSEEIKNLNDRMAILQKQQALESSARVAQQMLPGGSLRDTAIFSGVEQTRAKASINAGVAEAVNNDAAIQAEIAKNNVSAQAAKLQLSNLQTELGLNNQEMQILLADKASLATMARVVSLKEQINNAERLNNAAELSVLRAELAAETNSLISASPALSSRKAAADAENKKARLAQNLEAQRMLDSNLEYQRLLSEQNARKPRAVNQTIGQRIGTALSSPGEFLGGGMLTTARYAIPSAMMWGMSRVVADGFRDAEEFNLVLSQLEIQFKDTGHGGEEAFKRAKEQIVAVSKESGIAAAEIAEIRRHVEGAFGGMTDIDLGDATGSRGGLMGNDGIIRYGEELVERQTEAAAKLSLVTGISTAELTDGLTAASLAFGASGDRIGDVAAKLESVGGTRARDLISFIGDIGPSAQEAGFKLEELMAIANSALKRSGMNGAAIAEQMGRIMAAMSNNTSAFFDIADSNRNILGDEGYNDFISSVQSGDTRKVFMTLAKYYKDLDKASRDSIVNMIGGQRQANTLLAAFGDSAGLDEMTKAAEDSFGALDRRYDNLRKKVSITLTRLKAEFNEFVRLIMDAGIVDAVNNILSGFTGILAIVGQLAKPVIAFNDALGGTLSSVAGIAIQIAALRVALFGLQKFKGTPTGMRFFGEGGLGGVGRSTRMGGAGWLASNTSSGRAYRDSLIHSNMRNMPMGALAAGGGAALGNRSNAALRSGLGVGGKLRAAGSGMLALVGGASGVGFLAGAGILAGYSALAGAAEDDRNAIKELQVELRTGDKSADEMRQMAEEIRTKTSGWSKTWGEFWRDLWNITPEDEIYEIEANVKDSQERRDALSMAISYGQVGDEDIIRDVIFEGLSDITPEKYDKSFFGDIAGRFTGDGAGIKSEEASRDFARFLQNIGLGDGSQASLTPEMVEEALIFGDVPFEDLFYAIREGSNEAYKSLDADLRKAIYSSGNSQEFEKRIQSLYNRAQESGDLSSERLYNAILTGMQTTIATDPRSAGLYAEANGVLNEFINASGDDLTGTYEAMREQYAAGRISREQYLQATDDRLKQLQTKASRTPQEDKLMADIQKNQSTDLISRLDTLTSIQETMSNMEPDTAFQKAYDRFVASQNTGANVDFASALRNLDGDSNVANSLTRMAELEEIIALKQFTDTAAVSKAISEYMDLATKVFEGTIETAPIEEARRMAAEGFIVPDSIQSAGTILAINQTDEWAEYSQDFSAFMVQVLAQDAAVAEGTADARRDLLDILSSSGFDVGTSPDEILAEFAAEISSTEGLTQEMWDKLMALYTGIGDKLTSDINLSESDMEQLEGSANLALTLMLAAIESGKAAGLENLVIPEFRVPGLGGGWKAKFSKLGANLRGVIGTFADAIKAGAEELKASEQRFQEHQDKMQDLMFDRLRVGASGDDKALAKIDRSQALSELERAQRMPSGTAEETYARDEAIYAARTSILRADKAAVEAIEEANTGRFDLMEALAESNGDIIAAAQVGLARAQDQLSRASGDSEIASAQAAIIRANESIRQAMLQQRDAQVGLLRTMTGDDPLAQAQFDLAFAKIQEGEARGILAKAEAAKATIEAQRNLNQAMFDVQQSMYDLRQAQFQAMDDEVGAAQVAAEAARAQLANAVSRGAGEAEMNQIRAQIISADKAARDTLLNSQLDEYQYLLDTGKITQSQYIEYLQGLQSTLDPASKQFKDLERTLYRLKNDIGADLQMNLPTDLTLPTLYQARRLDQSTGISAGGATVGYQDNRTMDIQITIGQNMTEDQIVTVLSNALGTGRNAITTPKRW